MAQNKRNVLRCFSCNAVQCNSRCAKRVLDYRILWSLENRPPRHFTTAHALALPWVMWLRHAIHRWKEEANVTYVRVLVFFLWFSDLKVMVLGRGTKDAYSSLVADHTFDAFTLTDNLDGTSITQAINSVISRITESKCYW